ncbi:DNA adenine methylase [Herbaspirillum sp. alder98]|uniref:DNA adenine methylase n=1 Tax=Herbaspirillum sp. alder98 TaxID=2913096 RepID=UPI001CD82E62|nr:DNA adenine methylase [Herbaspirillum sp. alder98]MCA1326219.1 DNA adenine methylase [Herbaspirillum sp. alder98]
MFSKKLYTPLRYPGGKARFAPFIGQLMVSNGLAGGHYFEPYAGGAGVALELLFHGVCSHAHINDLDPAIYDFWHSVIHAPEDLLRLIADTPVSMEQWHYWRNVMRGEIVVTQVERGFATLFMNRTNRSGILKGGVIGGLCQSGAYKLDARYKKDVLMARIQRIASHSNHISVYHEDALSLLKRCKDFLPLRSLIYLDPPYYMKGQGLYRNFYEHKDHAEIAHLLQGKRFSRSWVVSYDNVAEIQSMYAMAKALSYGLNYSAQKQYIGSEIMFFSDRLATLPDVSESLGEAA